MLQDLRRWLTQRVTDAALAAAPHVRPREIDQLARGLARIGPHCPVIARTVAENLRAVGLYTPAVHREYFAQVSEHFRGALHALRCAAERPDGANPDFLRFVEERIMLDDSVERLRAAAAGGRGVVIMGPHIANFLLNLPRLHQVIPLTIYMRWSRHAGRRAAKHAWCRTAGMQPLAEPRGQSGGGKLAALANAVRAGARVYITPDMPRRRHDGTPVAVFGREVYLPAGAAVLAVRTGAPLFMLTAARDGQRQRLFLDGPAPGGSEEEGTRAVVQRHMAWFAERFERFVRAQPALWYSWGDKRWGRVFRGDPEYTAAIAADGGPAGHVPAGPER